jgi:transposase
MTLDVREERGRQLASVAEIRRVGRRWMVPSQSQASERYIVDLEASTCTCPDFELRRGTCKHQHAVLFWIAWGHDVDPDRRTLDATAIVGKRKTYAQEDWSTYNASQVHERDYVERLLRDLCAGLEPPPRKPGPGRKRRPIGDATFAAVMKVFTTMSGRRAQSDLRSCVARGHLGSAGHFNSISNFLASPDSTPLIESLIEQSAVPLRLIEEGQFAIDSTGMSTVTYDRWFDQKHGALQAKHHWVKLHVMVGTATHVIASARVSPEGDAPQLPLLLERTKRRFDVREVSADKAYSSVANHEVLDKLGVDAYIPFKVNAVINPKAAAWSRHLCAFVFNQEKFLSHYHRRSNAETVFSMVKRKFGGAVASRLPTAQVNEVLCKCLAHNLCCVAKAIFMSGLAPAFWSDATDAPAMSPPAALALVHP